MKYYWIHMKDVIGAIDFILKNESDCRDLNGK
ncbi:hypothetical protein D1AOALGA4SA_6030 [Olavius algarvensis Delta 1 endosymbiont]|nr:hypothetical protein D1AOALGA4SA_6030 [Olavius algarvensis Delta 1 endosymbiont]